ncbi:GNAT family N-acetyltransferase [Clostridium neuense]|uniref:GNAT family N-acetyltransferase n=1 Tax=Clostridium neuense TaxID=1728934 RepID=A0ABW8TCR0_9CLOT
MISVVRANENEADEIKKLLNLVWLDTYREFFSQKTVDYIINQSQTVSKFKAEIQDKKILFLVAKDSESKVVGLATAQEEEDGIFLKRLYIHPDCQRNGIGIKLLSGVIESFKKASRIYLEVEKDNIKGSNFYNKCGFKAVRENNYDLNGDKFSTMLMEKTIHCITVGVK